MRAFLFKLIEKWPGYQEIPDNTVGFVIKQRLRLFLLYFGSWVRVKKYHKKKLYSNLKLKNSQKGKPFLLIASGPSADEVILETYRNNLMRNSLDVGVVNWYFESKYSKKLIPNYYFISDPVFFGKKISGLDEYFLQHPDINLVIPFTSEKQGIINKIFYVNNLMYYKKRKILSPMTGNLTPSSVVFHAISFLLYLGYFPIYICGLDVSYNRNIEVNEINEIFLNKKSLYGAKSNLNSVNDNLKVKLSDRDITPRNMMEALMNEAVMLRDLKYYNNMGLINVGKDNTNDALPRASLYFPNS